MDEAGRKKLLEEYAKTKSADARKRSYWNMLLL